MRRSSIQYVGMLCVIVLSAGCGASRVNDGPPRSGSAVIPEIPPDAVPRREPKSRYGNSPVYEVLGKRYAVMNSSKGYTERGVASWYGKKFHGNLTSNREPYDMYAMTAAHKSLPLPTYVRVRNLSNNKSVVVRVNDRGPFVHNRIIDLSYSAARKLDMIKTGTSLVEVEAISFDEPPGDRPTKQTTAAAPTQATVATKKTNRVFAQVGAFGDRKNAERRLAAIRSSGIGTAFVLEDMAVDPTLYRVRIGPIVSVEQFDLLVAALEKMDITDPYLVTE